MAYINGSVTDANPGPALYALIAPALTTAGFTLVDTVTIATRTHKIWKSAAANNTANLDWYLDIGYPTTGAGGFTMQPFEFYDPATDLGYRGLYSAFNTTVDAATSSRFGATGSALETNWLGQAGATSYTTTVPVTAFNYWVSATGNRVIMLQSNDTAAVVYVGLYTPNAGYATKAGAALYPLVGARVGVSWGSAVAATSHTTIGTVTAALTRIPPATVVGGGNGWGGHLVITQIVDRSVMNYATPILPSGSTAVMAFTAYPAALWAWNTTNASLSAQYGTLPDLAFINGSGSVLRGDTVTIAGTQWVLSAGTVPSGLTNPVSVLFKAA